MRVGLGFDAHGLVTGRALVLGGVRVPSDFGLAGHSDGDALVHAVIDACLGAAGLPDLGTSYPASEETRGVYSAGWLPEVGKRLTAAGWHVAQVDATVVAERPRLAPFTSEMGRVIALGLGLDPEQVAVKAKSTDGLGFAGRGEGIAALAVVLLEQITPGEGSA